MMLKLYVLSHAYSNNDSVLEPNVEFEFSAKTNRRYFAGAITNAVKSLHGKDVAFSGGYDPEFDSTFLIGDRRPIYPHNETLAEETCALELVAGIARKDLPECATDDPFGYIAEKLGIDEADVTCCGHIFYIADTERWLHGSFADADEIVHAWRSNYVNWVSTNPKPDEEDFDLETWDYDDAIEDWERRKNQELLSFEEIADDYLKKTTFRICLPHWNCYHLSESSAAALEAITISQDVEDREINFGRA